MSISRTFLSSIRKIRHTTVVLVAVAVLTMGLVNPVLPAGAETVVAPSATTITNMQINLLKAMNRERSWHSLPPLRMSTKLQASAKAHNVRMAKANTMSHLLPGEPDLGTRIKSVGYNWRWCGENIAWTTWIAMDGLYWLQRKMYNEVAPNDGHRRIILSTKYKDVGISVYYDSAHGKLWLTQDFGVSY